MQDVSDKFLSPAVFSQLFLEWSGLLLLKKAELKLLEDTEKHSQMQMYLVKCHI